VSINSCDWYLYFMLCIARLFCLVIFMVHKSDLEFVVVLVLGIKLYWNQKLVYWA
jgi:hypothetical protein